MRQIFRSQPLFLALFAAMVVGLGCGNSNVPIRQADTTCPTSSASIGIYDSMMIIFCGCAETAGVPHVTAGSLSCTVNAGSVVHFHYLGKLKHQILSTTTGGQTFSHSPLFDPKSASPVRAYSTSVPTAGTYSFSDAFSPTSSGQIIAL